MPSVSEEASSSRMVRFGYNILSGLVSKSDNIDISLNGQLILLSEETIHILTPAVGFSPLLKASDTLKSHHDPAQDILLFNASISIKDCPQDALKAGSGTEAYLLAYEARFMDAKWSPIMYGPNASPILAALTTQSQIILFAASMNQFTGPWKQTTVLEGESDQHITSIAWIEHDDEHIWLIAGTRKGCIITWLIQGDKAIHSSTQHLLIGEISSLYWSGKDHLAIITNEGVFIAQVSTSATQLSIQVGSLRPQPPSGSSISTARWHKTQLAYCTPGQVHAFDAVSGESGSVLLEGAEDDALSCSMRPAAAIHYDIDTQRWRASLQDGSEYQFSVTQLLDGTEYISPSSFLAPANEAIGTLQRTVETTRGLYSKKEDGSGLTFLCHDANSIASWSYFRDPKCQFGICITHAPKSSQELQRASVLISAALQGGTKELQALIIYYTYSGKKADWAILIMHSLERASKERMTLQGAIRLSAWLQREQIKEVKDRIKSQVHDRLIELASASILLGNVVWLLTSPDDQSVVNTDPANILFGKLNCKIAQTMAERTNDDALRDAATRLQQLLQRKGALGSIDDIHVEEKCPACSSEILIEDEALLQAKCKKGHLWKRCASTYTILTTSYNMICSICSRESIRIEDAASPAQTELLARYKSCRMCNGKLVL